MWPRGDIPANCSTPLNPSITPLNISVQVEFYRGQTVTPGDRYLPVMREFMAMASVRLAELEDLFTDMKARFDRVCRMFCEDPTTTQSDEFFGIFDHFITSFAEAKMDNDNAKKKKEEEEKIAKQHQEVFSFD